MIKKWSYVAAAMLTVASGLALTSCIDNDEPYGIEQIRLATASLLEAKKSAVNAEQAAKEAEIEIAKINAEAARLQAENQKILNEAEAKIKEAQAKAIELQAQADAAKTQAEAAKWQAEAAKWQAEADKVQAETEAYIASQKAQLDEFIAQAEIRVKSAQQQYDKAVYDFEQQKIKDANLANDNLYKAWAAAFESYLGQLAEVNRLNAEYLNAQKDYALADIDLAPDGNGGWISMKYDALKTLENTVKNLENEIAEQNEKIDFYNNHINVIKDFQSTDELYQLYEKYEADKEANTKALAEANVEKATLEIENKDLYESYKSLVADFNAYARTESKEIPAYTWEPDAALAAIGLSKPDEVAPAGLSFTMDDVSNYDYVRDNYLTLIEKLQAYLLDENDIAWTQASINEMNRLLGYAIGNSNEAVKDWNNAKKAYNMGNTPDYSVIPLETETQDALTAYEAEATKCVSLRQAKIAADAAYDAAIKKVQDEDKALQGNPASQANKRDAINKAYSDAYQAARDAREAAWDNADADYTKTMNAAQEARQKAWNDVTKADLNLQEANNNGASAAQIEKLQKAYDDAIKVAYEKETAYSTTFDKAFTARDKAYTAANIAYQRATLAADEKYTADVKAWQAAGGDDLSKDPAAAAYLTALKDYDKAREEKIEADNNIYSNDNKVWNSFEALKTAFYQQSNAVGGWNINNIWTLQAELDDFLNGSLDVTEFPTTYLPSHLQTQAVYVNVKQYLINASRYAYGSLGFDYDPHNSSWDYDEAFLVDNVTKDMINSYIAEMYPWMDEFNYPYYYNALFGKFGRMLYLQNRVDVATAMVANQSLLTDAIKPLQENLEALEGLMNDLREGQVDLSNKMNEKKDQIDALEADVNAKIKNLNHWDNLYTWALQDITANIGLIAGDPSINGSEGIKDILNASIENAEAMIAVCNNRIEGLNESLAKAKYQLDQYVNNEGVINGNPVAITVQNAEAALNAAKELLQLLKNRADELQAKYEAANK